MSWQDSLVRIADHEVDELKKRLAAVVDRRVMMEMKIAILQAEMASECAHMAQDAEAGLYRIGFLQGWRMRRDAYNLELESIELEEAGARDALGRAYEELKKYEQVSETARAVTRAADAKRDRAVLDELGLRGASGR